MNNAKNMMMISIILATLATIVLFSLIQAINIPTDYLDEFFEVPAALNRLAQGQLPGKDFFTPLNLGPLFLLLPAYFVAGLNVSGAIFSAYFATLIMLAVSLTIFFLLATRAKNLSLGILFGALGIALLMLLNAFSLDDTVFPMLLYPFNNLKAITAFIPCLSAAIAWCIFKTIANPWRRWLALGILSGFMLLWSNDYLGFSSVALLFLITAIREYSIGTKSIFLGLFLQLMTAIIIAFLLTLIVTGGHVFELINQVIYGLHHDRWWYHEMSYLEYSKAPISNFNNFTDDINLILPSYKNIIYIGIASLVGLLYISIQKNDLQKLLLFYVGGSLFLGSGISIIEGGFFLGYWYPIILWIPFAVIALLSAFKQYNFTITKHFLWVILFAIVLIITMLAFIKEWNSYRNEINTAKNATSRLYVSELGGYLPVEWGPFVELARSSRNASFVEEYWGLWSAITKKSNGLKVDSVIQALGDVRTNLPQMINNHQPDFIITTRREYSEDYSRWQSWNFNSNWWFYRILAQNYKPFFASPATLVWKKSENKYKTVPVSCFIESGNQPLIRVVTNKMGLYDVQFNYFLQPQQSRVVLSVKNNINYGSGADGYVSLDPKATSAHLPILPDQFGHVKSITKLDFKLTGTENSVLKLEGCSAFFLGKTTPEIMKIATATESAQKTLTLNKRVKLVKKHKERLEG